MELSFVGEDAHVKVAATRVRQKGNAQV